MSANLSKPHPFETDSMLFGLPKQLFEVNNTLLAVNFAVTSSPLALAPNFGVVFDLNLSLSDYITAISKSCLSHIRDLRRIKPLLNLSTACDIPTALIHHKLYYCKSVLLYSC